MRLLHTADWQLGMTFPSFGAAAPTLSSARFALVERLAELARDRSVDLVVVAGDVFDGPALSGSRLLEVARALGAFGCPVLLLPGNHDPHIAGGIWERDEWAEAGPDVVRLLDAAPQRIESLRLVVHPCPLTSAHSTADPTDAITGPFDADWIHVGVAHGGMRGALTEVGSGDDHPIDLVRPELAALDYLALGDWHSLRVEREGRAAYCGTPEPCRFGERDSGQALIVEIEAPGALPQLEAVPTATHRWLRMQERVDSVADAAALARALGEIEAPRTTVVELRLSGSPDLPALEALDGLESLAPRFLCCAILREEIALRMDPEQLAQLAPPGPLGRAVERVAAHLDSDQRRVAEEALRLFGELAREH